MPTEAEKVDGSNTIENLVSLMAQETEKQLNSYVQLLDKTVDTVQNWEMRKAEIKREMDDLNATALKQYIGEERYTLLDAKVADNIICTS